MRKARSPLLAGFVTVFLWAGSFNAHEAFAQHGHVASGLLHGIPDFCENATVRSAGNGAWSSPATWNTGRVPRAGDLVSIAHAVTYDTVSNDALACVEVRGQLTFRTNTNTRMVVGTLMVFPNGVLEIGTPAAPVSAAVTAEIVIADRPLDTTQDPEQFGTGVVGLGAVTISGTPRTTFVRLGSEAAAGSNQLSTEAVVEGWRAGDRLVIPDTRSSAGGPLEGVATTAQWEELSAASVSATTVALAAPLRFSHEGARDGNGTLSFLPHIGNLTRNVIIRSANPAGTRGHVIFATRSEVDIRYVLFKDLGRTKITPLDNTTFDTSNRVTKVGTNQIGRYPLHMHHVMGGVGPSADGYQFRLIGNAIDGGKKWGLAVHNSHYGWVRGNVIYNVEGSGLVTEDGSESNNLIERNFVIRVIGPGDRGDGRGLTDLAWEGSGYWFRGTNNIVRDNVAANTPGDYGYKVFPYFIGNVRVPKTPGADTAANGEVTVIGGNALPLKDFIRNEAYGAMVGGLSYWWLNTVGDKAVANSTPAVIKDFHVWHFTGSAILHYPSSAVVIDGLVVRGRAGSGRYGFNGLDYMAKDILINNADIQGMTYGIAPSTHSGSGVFVVKDSYLRNAVNVFVGTPYTSAAEARNIPPRRIVLRNVKFDVPVTGSAVPLRAIQMKFDTAPVRNLIQKDEVYVYAFNGVASDNFKVFYSEQRSDFVVPAVVISQYNTHYVEGAPVAGMTNQQTLNTYGVAIAGGVAPCAGTRIEIDGFVCAIPFARDSEDGLPATMLKGLTPQ
jgi:G8 domain